MIRYGLYDNSLSECYWVAHLDPITKVEKMIHVHSSEIKRFHGYRPLEMVRFSTEKLLQFFTYRLDLEGQNGEYRKQRAKSEARMASKRSKGKPNSPGEGE